MGVQKSPLFRRLSTNGGFPISRLKKNVNYTVRKMNSNWILLPFFTLYDLAEEFLTYKIKRIKITELVNSNFERFILNIICCASSWFLHEQSRKWFIVFNYAFYTDFVGPLETLLRLLFARNRAVVWVIIVIFPAWLVLLI